MYVYIYKIKDISLVEKAPTIEESEDYILNSVSMKKPVFVGFKKPADNKGICKNNSQQFKLFMYGDAPSKLTVPFILPSRTLQKTSRIIHS